MSRVSAMGKMKISNFVTGNSSVTGYFERHMLLPQKKLKRQFAYRNAYLFICKYIFHLLMRFSQKETRRLPPAQNKSTTFGDFVSPVFIPPFQFLGRCEIHFFHSDRKIPSNMTFINMIV